MDKAALERRLSSLSGFEDPRADLEQYPTPAWLAAHLVHLADLRGDVADERVLDLGAGTGVLALAAATRDPERVVGIERDRAALEVAVENEATVGPAESVGWLRADATEPPLPATGEWTVLTNPPFGAQRGQEHADRAFLAAAADLATVSYSIHNAGSRGFVESFVGDEGGTVTDAVAAELGLDRQFAFHDSERQVIDVEVYRVEW